MSNIVIDVDNISKKYAKNYKSALALLKKDIKNSFFCNTKIKKLECAKGEFIVLKDVSFKIYQHEKVAILGKNGAGKSTLLKLLFGIILPDQGKITIDGIVGGILELGGSLIKSLSGRENIYHIGSMYHKSSEEIKNFVNEIIEFTELGDFIDSPIEYYSSGMKSKLSFALYLYMKPDILILDEVFAAGDKNFRKKAKEKLFSLIDNSTTIIVSHDINIVKEIASRVIVLNKGQLIYDGDVSQGIKIYQGL